MKAANADNNPAPRTIPMARDDVRSSFAQLLLRKYCDVVLTGTVRLVFISVIFFSNFSVSFINRYPLLGTVVLEGAGEVPLQIPIEIIGRNKMNSDTDLHMYISIL